MNELGVFFLFTLTIFLMVSQPCFFVEFFPTSLAFLLADFAPGMLFVVVDTESLFTNVAFNLFLLEFHVVLSIDVHLHFEVASWFDGFATFYRTGKQGWTTLVLYFDRLKFMMFFSLLILIISLVFIHVVIIACAGFW